MAGTYRRGETDLFAYLRRELTQRIMIIDGAMGTMIQVRGAGRRPRCAVAALAARRAAVWRARGRHERACSRRRSTS
jgi:hypothetical protein